MNNSELNNVLEEIERIKNYIINLENEIKELKENKKHEQRNLFL